MVAVDQSHLEVWVKDNTAPTQSQTTDEILEERGQRYGRFETQADVAQGIKRAMRTGNRWNSLSAAQMESMDMIANKLGRILNGDPNYVDSWADVAGYAQLIVRILDSRGL